MPEGPEIKRAADAIAAVLQGRKIEEAELCYPALEGFDRYIEGHQIQQVETRGKAMLTHFSSGKTLYSHNQLYGVWKISNRGHQPPTSRALRLGLHTREHSVWLFSATDISLWNTEEVYQHPFLKRLGPDLLGQELTAHGLVRRLLRSDFENRSLASLLLDQKFIAGVGNYLRSEILFFASVNPTAKPKELNLRDKTRVAKTALAVGYRSYQTDGVTLPAALMRKPTKRSERYFERDRFAVFARDGEPCRKCDTPIKKAVLSARRIYWCPKCQTA